MTDDLALRTQVQHLLERLYDRASNDHTTRACDFADLLMQERPDHGRTRAELVEARKELAAMKAIPGRPAPPTLVDLYAYEVGLEDGRAEGRAQAVAALRDEATYQAWINADEERGMVCGTPLRLIADYLEALALTPIEEAGG